MTPAPALRFAYEEFDLANGLHVILHEDRALPIVGINLWYHVGSRHEDARRTGFAHLFEHMMFQGSEHVPANAHFRHVQEAGGTLNASTSFDRTNYFETLPSNRYELGLWLEADRMRSLAVTQENLDTQRQVVMEERRTRYDNQPYGTIWEELFRRVYTVQPYRWSVIGSMDHIAAATLEEVRAFHAAWYRPSNATLCVAGDVDPREAERAVRRHFDPVPDGGRPTAPEAPREPEPAARRRDTIEDAVPVPALAVAYPIPDLNHPDFTAVDVLAHLLGSGESSRLHNRLVYRTRLAQHVLAYAFGLELPGVLVFRATAAAPDVLAALEGEFFATLDALLRDGPDERETARTRNRMLTEFLRHVAPVQSRADALNGSRTLSGDTARLATEPDRIAAVTADDVHRVARAYLAPHRATVLAVLPRTGAAA